MGEPLSGEDVRRNVGRKINRSGERRDTALAFDWGARAQMSLDGECLKASQPSSVCPSSTNCAPSALHQLIEDGGGLRYLSKNHNRARLAGLIRERNGPF